MDFILLYALSAVILSIAMAVAWAIARQPGQSGWADAVWTWSVGVAGVLVALLPLNDAAQGSPIGPRQWLVAAMVGGWSLRLGIHIAMRSAGGHDDPRYAELRRQWKHDFSRRLFWFLQMQALAGWVLTVAVLMAARNGAPSFSRSDVIGVIILIVAVIGEGVADAQLQAFRKKPENAGRVCTSGLWSLSRHPNYFFEWLAWCAYPLVAIGSFGLPISEGVLVSYTFGHGWLTLGAPLMMYWLLVRVSGIPPLEAHMLRSRGNEFRAVQMRVSAFWLFPARRF